MKGYELIEKITNGEIKDGTRIKVICDDYYVTCIEVKNNALIWESGKFTTSELCDKHVWFEIIEDKPKKLDEINYNGACTLELLEEAFYGICEQINKQAKAVNFLLEKSDNK